MRDLCVYPASMVSIRKQAARVTVRANERSWTGYLVLTVARLEHTTFFPDILHTHHWRRDIIPFASKP